VLDVIGATTRPRLVLRDVHHAPPNRPRHEQSTEPPTAPTDGPGIGVSCRQPGFTQVEPPAPAEIQTTTPVDGGLPEDRRRSAASQDGAVGSEAVERALAKALDTGRARSECAGCPIRSSPSQRSSRVPENDGMERRFRALGSRARSHVINRAPCRCQAQARLRRRGQRDQLRCLEPGPLASRLVPTQ
jgi:hypothetical protein